MTTTIILPTYNEAENIALLIASIKKNVPSASILVVDDNSPDGTAKKVKTNTHVRLLLRTKNRGLTNSLQEGINNTKTDIVAWMDCDFSHPPEVLPSLISCIESGADIALAGRKNNSGLSFIINRISMFFFGNEISDYTTGFLAIRRTVLDTIPLHGNYGEYCIDLLVRAKRMRFLLKEIPYESPRRVRGYSKTSWKYGFGYISTIIRLLWKSGN